MKNVICHRDDHCVWTNGNGIPLTNIHYPSLKNSDECEDDELVAPPMPIPEDSGHKDPRIRWSPLIRLSPYSITNRFREGQMRRQRPGSTEQFGRLEVGVLSRQISEENQTEHFRDFNNTHRGEENMDRIVDSNSKSFIPVDIGKSYLNETIAYYQTIFGHLPNEYYAIDYDEANRKLDLEKSMEALEETFKVQNRFVFKTPDVKTQKTKIHEANYILEGGVLVYMSICFNAVIIVYDRPEQLDDILHEIVSTRVRRRKEKPKFHLLVHGNYGFNTEEFELKSFDVDVESNYNDDLPDEKIRHFIEAENEAGLCILHGKPGTGKTYYIRDLIKSSKRDFIYMSKECLNYISDAAFISFLTKHKNCVFIMEDCENVLVDRTQYNNTISTLLNLSDGLLGDSLNNKFVCSFNTDISNVDEALLRKGRMKVCYEFKYLNADKANALAEKLNKSERFEKDVPLCDVFNSESNGTEDIPSRKNKKIGF